MLQVFTAHSTHSSLTFWKEFSSCWWLGQKYWHAPKMSDTVFFKYLFVHLDVFRTITWKEINKMHCRSWIFLIGFQSIRDCKAQLSFPPVNVIPIYQIFLLGQNFQVIKKHYSLCGMIDFQRSNGDFAKAKWLLRIQTVGDPAATCERESCILSTHVEILVHALVTPKVSWSSVVGY